MAAARSVDALQGRSRSEDPSQTKTVRQRYARRLRGGFSRINTVIRTAVVEHDAFGLTFDALVTPPGDYSFDRDDRKVDGFVSWLERAQDEEVLELIGRDDNQYIRAAYERGLKNAHQNLRAEGVDVELADLERIFDQPVHRETVQNLYTRNFRELKGITEAVDQQVSRELSQALVEGVNPDEVADRITDRVDSIGKRRATVLARTETLNSHNEAALSRYEQVLGDDAAVQLEAEVMTAQDDRVCDECEPRHGEVMSIEDARADGPPFHAQCRCTYRPVVKKG